MDNNLVCSGLVAESGSLTGAAGLKIIELGYISLPATDKVGNTLFDSWDDSVMNHCLRYQDLSKNDKRYCC